MFTKDSNLTPTLYQLDQDNKNYLELWKFFANRGDSYKDKMWNITIWLYALLAGILGYMMSNFMGHRLNKEIETSINPGLIAEPELSILFSIFALLFCGYIVLTIKEYGEHVQHNWNRANYLLEKLKGLPEIWYSGLDAEEIETRLHANAKREAGNHWLMALPTVPRRLVYLTFGMMALFLAILVLAALSAGTS